MPTRLPYKLIYLRTTTKLINYIDQKIKIVPEVPQD